MIIETGSDLIITLDLKDDKGTRIRVSTKPSFYVKVFTADKNNYLYFDKAQIKCTSSNDTLYISSAKLATLESGVIAYTYGYGVSDDNFEDSEYNRSQTVYTDYYFKSTPAANATSFLAAKLDSEITRASTAEAALAARISNMVYVDDDSLIINTGTNENNI